MKNALNWFEVPAKDIKRAQTFYETILNVKMENMAMEPLGITMALFPTDMETGVGGSIAHGPGQEPSQTGATVYLNGGDDLNTPLSRVEAAGGTITIPKSPIGESGFIAQFIDTEGNRIALHSRN